jgi:hypothetical protein
MKTYPQSFVTPRLLLILLCASGLSLARAERPGPAEGIQTRAKFAESITAVFKAGKFEELEKTAKELRASKARFPEGLWKLSIFYNGIHSDAYSNRDAEWTECFQKLDQWKTQYPNSITLCVARAEVLTSYAWKARGGDWASKVTPEGWKLFSERLAQARAVLEEGEKLSEKCPHWFAAMETVALGQGWDREEEAQLFKEAGAFEPQYYDYYFRRVTYLLPRWHGEQGEWEKFAEEMVKENPGGEGKTIYARIAWSATEYYNNLFKDTGIQWPLMKQGFEEMMKHYPTSNWNLNAFAKFAVQAEDRATARELVKRIGNHYLVEPWGTPGTLQAALAWIEKPNSQTKPRATFASENGDAESIAFSHDGKFLTAGYENGQVVLWEIATGKQARSFETDPDVRSIAFSPDGKLMAAGTGSLYSTEPGSVQIWDTGTWQEYRKIPAVKGPVAKVRFAPDGKSLITTGGPCDKSSEVMIWNLATKAVTHIPELEHHKHHLLSLAISPDSQVIVTDCTHPTFVPWDLAQGKYVLDKYPMLKPYPASVAFSPDGKLLAVGGAQRWDKVREPGELKIYDVPGWDKKEWIEHKPGIVGTFGGQLSVSFSPDGKLLAGGGLDHCVRIWKVATGQEISTLVGHDSTIFDVAFSPDGQSIAASGEDGSVKLWKTPPSD